MSLENLNSTEVQATEQETKIQAVTAEEAKTKLAEIQKQNEFLSGKSDTVREKFYPKIQKNIVDLKAGIDTALNESEDMELIAQLDEVIKGLEAMQDSTELAEESVEVEEEHNILDEDQINEAKTMKSSPEKMVEGLKEASVKINEISSKIEEKRKISKKDQIKIASLGALLIASTFIGSIKVVTSNNDGGQIKQGGRTEQVRNSQEGKTDKEIIRDVQENIDLLNELSDLNIAHIEESIPFRLRITGFYANQLKILKKSKKVDAKFVKKAIQAVEEVKSEYNGENPFGYRFIKKAAERVSYDQHVGSKEDEFGQSNFQGVEEMIIQSIVDSMDDPELNSMIYKYEPGSIKQTLKNAIQRQEEEIKKSRESK